MTDTDQTIDAEVELEEGTNELYLSDGEVWIADVWELCKHHKIVGLANEAGVTMAFIEGKGAVLLSDLLKAKKSPARLASVK